TPAAVPGGIPVREVPKVSADATDDDWLRSRTNRLLDLVDPDDPEFAARAVSSAPAAAATFIPETKEPAHAESIADADGPDHGAPVPAEDTEDAIKQVEKTRRLFLRNLSY